MFETILSEFQGNYTAAFFCFPEQIDIRSKLNLIELHQLFVACAANLEPNCNTYPQ